MLIDEIIALAKESQGKMTIREVIVGKSVLRQIKVEFSDAIGINVMPLDTINYRGFHFREDELAEYGVHVIYDLAIPSLPKVGVKSWRS